MRVVAATWLCAATLFAGCYRSHVRPSDAGARDARASSDAPARADTATFDAPIVIVARDAGPPIDAWTCPPAAPDLTARGRDCSTLPCPPGYECLTFGGGDRACFDPCEDGCGCPMPFLCGGGGVMPPGTPLVCGPDCPTCGIGL